MDQQTILYRKKRKHIVLFHNFFYSQTLNIIFMGWI